MYRSPEYVYGLQYYDDTAMMNNKFGNEFEYDMYDDYDEYDDNDDFESEFGYNPFVSKEREDIMYDQWLTYSFNQFRFKTGPEAAGLTLCTENMTTCFVCKVFQRIEDLFVNPNIQEIGDKEDGLDIIKKLKIYNVFDESSEDFITYRFNRKMTRRIEKMKNRGVWEISPLQGGKRSTVTNLPVDFTNTTDHVYYNSYLCGNHKEYSDKKLRKLRSECIKLFKIVKRETRFWTSPQRFKDMCNTRITQYRKQKDELDKQQQLLLSRYGHGFGKKTPEKCIADVQKWLTDVIENEDVTKITQGKLRGLQRSCHPDRVEQTELTENIIRILNGITDEFSTRNTKELFKALIKGKTDELRKIVGDAKPALPVDIPLQLTKYTSSANLALIPKFEENLYQKTVPDMVVVPDEEETPVSKKRKAEDAIEIYSEPPPPKKIPRLMQDLVKRTKPQPPTVKPEPPSEETRNETERVTTQLNQVLQTPPQSTQQTTTSSVERQKKVLDAKIDFLQNEINVASYKFAWKYSFFRKLRGCLKLIVGDSFRVDISNTAYKYLKRIYQFPKRARYYLLQLSKRATGHGKSFYGWGLIMSLRKLKKYNQEYFALMEVKNDAAKKRKLAVEQQKVEKAEVVNDQMFFDDDAGDAVSQVPKDIKIKKSKFVPQTIPIPETTDSIVTVPENYSNELVNYNEVSGVLGTFITMKEYLTNSLCASAKAQIANNDELKIRFLQATLCTLFTRNLGGYEEYKTSPLRKPCNVLLAICNSLFQIGKQYKSTEIYNLEENYARNALKQDNVLIDDAGLSRDDPKYTDMKVLINLYPERTITAAGAAFGLDLSKYKLPRRKPRPVPLTKTKASSDDIGYHFLIKCVEKSFETEDGFLELFLFGTSFQTDNTILKVSDSNRHMLGTELGKVILALFLKYVRGIKKKENVAKILNRVQRFQPSSLT